MGTDAHGWIELRTEPGLFWRPIVLIDTLPFRDYVVFGSIFGVASGSSDPMREPFAADRGIPADVSAYVKSEIQTEGAGQFHHSWVLWSEVQNTWLATDAKSPLSAPLSVEWLALRGMMSALAESYGADNVRLVIWFN